MKKHTLQENYERLFGSIKENWWDKLSDKSKQSYISKHGSAPNVAKDGDSEKGKDTGKDADSGGDTVDAYEITSLFPLHSDDPDAPAPKDDKLNAKKSAMEDEMEDIAKELDTVTDPDEKADLEDKYDELDKELKSINKKQYGENYERLFGPIKENWWDKLSDKSKQSYISKHGSAPNVAKDGDSEKGKDTGKDADSGGDTVDAYEIMDNPASVLTGLDEFEDEGMDVDDIKDRVEAMKDLDGEEYEDEAFAIADELKDMKKSLHSPH
jgi:hypothetical protein